MARVSKWIDASPAEVFDVLSNGWLYSNWVVGTSHMRAVDPRWPAAGSVLHHCSGLWPMVTRDETIVQRCDKDRRLDLIAKGGALGKADIVLTLEPSGSGTEVTMYEQPIAGFGKWVHNSVSDRLLAKRNVEALARLTAMTERHETPRD